MKKFNDFLINEGEESASDRFSMHLDSIKFNIDLLKKSIENLEKDQSSDKTNWGFAGSAEKINEDLIDIIDFLGYYEGKKTKLRK